MNRIERINQEYESLYSTLIKNKSLLEEEKGKLQEKFRTIHESKLNNSDAIQIILDISELKYRLNELSNALQQLQNMKQSFENKMEHEEQECFDMYRDYKKHHKIMALFMPPITNGTFDLTEQGFNQAQKSIEEFKQLYSSVMELTLFDRTVEDSKTNSKSTSESIESHAIKKKGYESMNKYEELILLQKYIGKYRVSLNEQLQNAKGENIYIEDLRIDDIGVLRKNLDSITDRDALDSKLAEVSKAILALTNIEISFSTPTTTILSDDQVDQLETNRINELKRALAEFKRNFQPVLKETFLNLAYENGAYNDLESEEKQEKFESELTDKLQSGQISKEDYEALQYGLMYCSSNEREQVSPIKKEPNKLVYDDKVDRGDNSYEEFVMIKDIIERYGARQKLAFDRDKDGLTSTSSQALYSQMLIDDSTNYQIASNLLNKLSNIEMLLSASTSTSSEIGSDLLSGELLKFKQENFDQIAIIMSESYMALRDTREKYDNVTLYSDPRTQSGQEFEIELRDLLTKGSISQEDYDIFTYTMGYYVADYYRDEPKSTQVLGKETLEELKDTQYIDSTFQTISHDEQIRRNNANLEQSQI